MCNEVDTSLMTRWYKIENQKGINIVPGEETENNTQNPEGVYTAV